MVTTILIVLVALVVGVLVMASTKPATFRIERSISIHAPPDRIFGLIDDFRQWPRWSPWENVDPTMTRTLSGAASGVGAAYAWLGNNKVGQGRMEITASVPPSRVTIQLDFLKPFEAHNIAEFTLTQAGEATNVTWAMHGPNRFVSKIMSVFVSFDRMVGKDFEAGLAAMKAAAEG